MIAVSKNENGTYTAESMDAPGVVATSSTEDLAVQRALGYESVAAARAEAADYGFDGI